MSVSLVDLELAKAVNQAIRRYQRVWWADRGEMRQEAWTAALAARDTWEPAKGPIGPYAYQAIRRSLATYLVRQSAPVSASWHRRFELCNLTRAPLEAVEHDAAPGAWSDELLHDRRWHVRVFARLREVVGEEGLEGLEELLAERPRNGRPSRRLQDSIAVARRRIAEDEELRALWSERGDA